MPVPVRGGEHVRAEVAGRGAVGIGRPAGERDRDDVRGDGPADAGGLVRGGEHVGRAGQQQREQVGADPFGFAGPLGLLAREPLDARGRQLVHVEEDRLGERDEQVGVEVLRLDAGGEPAKRHSGTDPVGGEEGLERPALT